MNQPSNKSNYPDLKLARKVLFWFYADNKIYFQCSGNFKKKPIYFLWDINRKTHLLFWYDKQTYLWWFSVVKKNMESLCVELKTGSRDHILDSLQTKSAFGFAISERQFLQLVWKRLKQAKNYMFPSLWLSTRSTIQNYRQETEIVNQIRRKTALLVVLKYSEIVWQLGPKRQTGALASPILNLQTTISKLLGKSL